MPMLDTAPGGPRTETRASSSRRTRLFALLFALPEMRWAVAALALFLAGLTVQILGGPAWAYWPLYLACYAAGGWEPGWAGLKALRRKVLDVDLLMVAAALGAAAIGQVMDGALLIVIFATSGALEALATARTEDSVRGLLDLAPETATRVDHCGDPHGDGDGRGETPVPVADLAVGDVIHVRPGERVGADGHVLEGVSEVDQATITGEPLPVGKAAGDEVFAGTLNGTGALRVRVSRPADESVVARIAALVEQAARTKARTQLFIEKVEQRYSIAMVAATVLLFTIPLLAGRPLQPSLLRAMTFMIVASPCAVVLATMPPLLAAIANAGRHGVLVKSAVVMERLGATGRVAFDKTGTLTRGTPHVTETRPVPGSGLSERDVLALAAAAEHPSEHHLARAIVTAAREHGAGIRPVEAFTALPGRGVSGQVDGRPVQVGTPTALLTQHAHSGDAPQTPTQKRADTPDVAWARTVADKLAAGGATALVVLADDRPVGVLGIADRIRPEATAAVASLTTLTGHTPVLLTGDNHPAAARLAADVGIADIRAGLLPEDKVTAVRRLQAAPDDQNGAQNRAQVAVVGDGINDAPALAAADTGLAMGGAGADLTLQTADAVIVRDDLTTIPAVIALSRTARRVVTANLIIAAAFITGLILWDLLGHLPLPLGVAGHEGSTVIVGLNGLRLLRHRAWQLHRPGSTTSTSTLM